MKDTKPTLLIPVENQVRELDAKILLACVAACRGLRAVIGPRQQIEFNIADFPKSVYIAKSLKSGNGSAFKILKMFGHSIVAWDEEALVHLPPETYFARRFSPKAVKHVSNLFAWGNDNFELWHKNPTVLSDVPVAITGNPRGDLLRPDLRRYYQEEVTSLQKEFGRFILINTNFNQVNAFSPLQNLFLPPTKNGSERRLGSLAEGMERQFAKGLWEHKRHIFDDFKNLIPKLEKTFSDCNIVVRPHPGENSSIYQDIATQCKRVRVTNEGNVVPWLMAAKAVIHNGCTTGVEACVLGIPTLSYRASVDAFYDDAFHRLPNQLSHQCFDFGALRQALEKILAGQMDIGNGSQRTQLIHDHLAALTGPLACERIVDRVIAIHARAGAVSPNVRIRGWVGRYRMLRRRISKKLRALSGNSHKTPALQKHNYPGIDIEDMKERINRFKAILGFPNELGVHQQSDQIYRVES